MESTPDLSPSDLARGYVRIDIFSGRPNPEWLLSDDQIASLETAVNQLPTISPLQPPAHLGYRGIQVNISGEKPAPRSLIWVYDGKVIHWSDDIVSYYEDKDRQLEQWLLELSKPNVDADMYATIAAEVAK